MTRLDQAFRWWRNHKKTSNSRFTRTFIPSKEIPERHLRVLTKHNAIYPHVDGDKVLYFFALPLKK